MRRHLTAHHHGERHDDRGREDPGKDQDGHVDAPNVHSAPNRIAPKRREAATTAVSRPMPLARSSSGSSAPASAITTPSVAA
jgi:hypothetical protein